MRLLSIFSLYEGISAKMKSSLWSFVTPISCFSDLLLTISASDCFDLNSGILNKSFFSSDFLWVKGTTPPSCLRKLRESLTLLAGSSLVLKNLDNESSFCLLVDSRELIFGVSLVSSFSIFFWVTAFSFGSKPLSIKMES